MTQFLFGCFACSSNANRAALHYQKFGYKRCELLLYHFTIIYCAFFHRIHHLQIHFIQKKRSYAAYRKKIACKITQILKAFSL